MTNMSCGRRSRAVEAVCGLALLCLGVFAPCAEAQVETNSFEWVRAGGGTQNDQTTGLAAIGSTGVVVVGNHGPDSQLDGRPMASAGGLDFFVARYDANGTLDWLTFGGSPLEDLASGVSVDGTGASYVAGAFRSKCLLSGGAVSLQTRGTPGTSDAFLAKYSPTGALVWVAQMGGTADDRAYSVAFDGLDSVLVTGLFQGRATFGESTQLTSSNATVADVFLASYSLAGELKWVRGLSATRGMVAYGVRANSAHEVFVTGEYLGTATIGSQTLASAGDRDAFLAKFSSSGEGLWAQRFGGVGTDGAKALAVDSAGNLILGGYFNATMTVGTNSLSPVGRRDLWVGKWSPGGTNLWAVGGGGLQDDSVLGVAAGSGDSVYLTGSFIGAFSLAQTSLSASGNASDAFLARFSSGGSLQSLARCGGDSAVDLGNAVDAGSTGYVYLGGEFAGNGTFGTNTITTGQTTNRNFFVARRRVTQPVLASSPVDRSVNLGDPWSLEVVPSGKGPFSFRWFRDGSLVEGENQSVYSRTSAVPAHAGRYEVEVGNGEGVILTPAAEVRLFARLKLEVLGDGQVLRDPTTDRYPLGSPVGLLGEPGTNHFFSRWTGDLTGSDNPATLVMDGDKRVQVLFGFRGLNLAVEGEGAVIPDPPGPVYEPDQAVRLLAVPAEDFAFIGWSDGDTLNPREIQIGVSNRYVARFTNTVPVETLVFGGVSRVGPVGRPALFVDEEFVVSGPVLRGDSATLRLFSSFTNGVIVYSLDGGTPTTLYTGPFTLSGRAVVRAAAFSEETLQKVEMAGIEVRVVPSYFLRLTTPGGGTVAASPSRTRYLSNEVVTLTAVPTNGWTFLGWNGDVSGTTNPFLLSMTGNRVIEAVFGTSLAVSNDSTGVIELDPMLPVYPYGSAVRLTARPSSGSNFVSWAGSASGSVNPLSFQISRPQMVVRALFLTNGTNFPLNIRVQGAGTVNVFPRRNFYADGQTVLLIAGQDRSQDFLGWSGDLTVPTNRVSIVIHGPLDIVATFTSRPRLAWERVGADVAGNKVYRLVVESVLGSWGEVDRAASLSAWAPWRSWTNLLGRSLLDPGMGDEGNGFFRGRQGSVP